MNFMGSSLMAKKKNIGGVTFKYHIFQISKTVFFFFFNIISPFQSRLSLVYLVGLCYELGFAHFQLKFYSTQAETSFLCDQFYMSITQLSF